MEKNLAKNTFSMLYDADNANPEEKRKAFFTYLYKKIKKGKSITELSDELRKADSYTHHTLSISVFKSALGKYITIPKKHKKLINDVCKDPMFCTNDLVSYPDFIKYFKEFCTATDLITQIFEELYKVLSYTGKKDLEYLLKDLIKEDKISYTDFADALNKSIGFELTSKDILTVATIYNLNISTSLSYRAFNNDFNEYLVANNLSLFVDDAALSNIVEKLKNYCDSAGTNIYKFIKSKCTITESTITQSDFTFLLNEVLMLDIDNITIDAIKRDLDVEGHISVIKLCNKFKEKYGRNDYEENMSEKIYSYILANIATEFARNKLTNTPRSYFEEYSMENTGYISVDNLKELMFSSKGKLKPKLKISEEIANLFIQKSITIADKVNYEPILSALQLLIYERNRFEDFIANFQCSNIYHNFPFEQTIKSRDLSNSGFITTAQFKSVISESDYTLENIDTVIKVVHDCTLNDDSSVIMYSYMLTYYRQPYYSNKVVEKKVETPDMTPEQTENFIVIHLRNTNVNIYNQLYDLDILDSGTISIDIFVTYLSSLLPNIKKINITEIAKAYQTVPKTVDYRKFLDSIISRLPNIHTLLWEEWSVPLLRELQANVIVTNTPIDAMLQNYEMEDQPNYINRDRFSQALSEALLPSFKTDNADKLYSQFEQNSRLNVNDFAAFIKENENELISKFEAALYEYIITESGITINDMYAYMKEKDKANTNTITNDDCLEILCNNNMRLSTLHLKYIAIKFKSATNSLVSYHNFINDMQVFQDSGCPYILKDVHLVDAAKFIGDISCIKKIPLKHIFLTRNSKQDVITKVELANNLKTMFDLKLSCCEKLLAAVSDSDTISSEQFIRFIHSYCTHEGNIQEKTQQAASIRENINAYCIKYKKSLYLEFCKYDQEKTKYISYESYRQSFIGISFPLTSKDLTLLLNYSLITTDDKGRKNFIQLLFQIFGEEYTFNLIASEQSPLKSPPKGALPLAYRKGVTEESQVQYNKEKNDTLEAEICAITYNSLLRADSITKLKHYLKFANIPLLSYMKQFDPYHTKTLSLDQIKLIFDKLCIEIKDPLIYTLIEECRTQNEMYEYKEIVSKIATHVDPNYEHLQQIQKLTTTNFYKTDYYDPERRMQEILRQATENSPIRTPISAKTQMAGTMPSIKKKSLQNILEELQKKIAQEGINLFNILQSKSDDKERVYQDLFFSAFEEVSISIPEEISAYIKSRFIVEDGYIYIRKVLTFLCDQHTLAKMEEQIEHSEFDTSEAQNQPKEEPTMQMEEKMPMRESAEKISINITRKINTKEINDSKPVSFKERLSQMHEERGNEIYRVFLQYDLKQINEVTYDNFILGLKDLGFDINDNILKEIETYRSGNQVHLIGFFKSFTPEEQGNNMEETLKSIRTEVNVLYQLMNEHFKEHAVNINEFTKSIEGIGRDALIDKLNDMSLILNNYEINTLLNDLDLNHTNQISSHQFLQLISYAKLSQPFSRLIESFPSYLYAFVHQLECSLNKMEMSHDEFYDELLSKSVVEVGREVFIQTLVAKTDIQYLKDIQKMFEYLDYSKSKALSVSLLKRCIESLFGKAKREGMFVDFDAVLDKELEALFKSIDSNQDSTLSVDEMLTAIQVCNPTTTYSDAMAIVSNADTNKDGIVVLKEFIMYLRPKVKEMLAYTTDQMNDLRKVLKLYDKENKGYYTSNSLRSVL